jgi:hypothetical protein
MLTVFVGNNNQELADTATSHDQTAYLIDQENLKDNHTGTVYVSLADLSNVAQLNELLRSADTIVYVSCNEWSDPDKNYSQKFWTERSVQIFDLDQSKTVINCPKLVSDPKRESILHLEGNRKSENQQLWVAGCSTTYGLGVDTTQTYANLLSKELKIDYTLLARPGASIRWAADQILRSDIRNGDIVVWGLTSENRIPYYQDSLLHINASNFSEIAKDIMDINELDNSNSKYQTLTSIYQVVNYCNTIGAKLLMIGIHLGYEFAHYLKNLNCYIHLNNLHGCNHYDLYLDLGSDQLHPGPLTHQWYTKKILEKL